LQHCRTQPSLAGGWRRLILLGGARLVGAGVACLDGRVCVEKDAHLDMDTWMEQVSGWTSCGDDAAACIQGVDC
jgi:hypothetical protein